jgi:hypothetical protein
MMGSALVCLVAFTWKVFRAGKSWAKALCLGFAALMAMTVAAAMRSVEAADGANPPALVFNGLAVGALLWAFVECVLYLKVMRRRRDLGLANPIVVNRFLLWSLWTGALSFQGALQLVIRIAMWATGAGAIVAAGEDPGGPWLAMIEVIKLNLVIVAPTVVASVWLSFTPPAAYRRWVQGDQPDPVSV